MKLQTALKSGKAIGAAVLLTLGFSIGVFASEPTKAPSASGIAWPPPPQQARIVYVGEIASVQDVVGKQKRRFVDMAAGKKQQQNRSALGKPYGVASDSKGRIYVADAAARAVLVFDLESKKVEYRGTSAPAELALPIGIAIDDADRLYISDSFFHRVTCLDSDGNVLGVFGMDELQRPAGLAVDSATNRLYVADAKASRVAVFNTKNFQLISYVGGKSTPGDPEDGKFSAPTNVAVDHKGQLYVSDTWNNRIQIFAPDGKFIRTFGRQGVVPGTFVRPKGIAIDVDGHVYVADAEFNNIQVLTPEGRPLLAVGSLGSAPGQFALIAGMAFDKFKRLYVTDQYSGRVQVFRYVTDAEASGQR